MGQDGEARESKNNVEGAVGGIGHEWLVGAEGRWRHVVRVMEAVEATETVEAVEAVVVSAATNEAGVYMGESAHADGAAGLR